MFLRNRLLLLVLLVSGAFAHAEVTYRVRVDTTALKNHSAGPFTFAAQLAPGDGPKEDNYALLQQFSFGTRGEPCGSPRTIGGAFGELGSRVLLIDATKPNIFHQCFVAGDVLAFDLVLSTNVAPETLNGVPDGLMISLLDKTLSPLPTMLGDPLDAMVLIYIDSDTPTVRTFSGDKSRNPKGGGDPVAISAPTIGDIVSIDIKPGDYPNTIPRSANGVVPVAILASSTFNPLMSVDTTSLRFGRTGNEMSLMRCGAAGEDVNGDLLPDLVCHFYIGQCDFLEGDSVGILRGKTLSTLLIEGKDSVRVLMQP